MTGHHLGLLMQAKLERVEAVGLIVLPPPPYPQAFCTVPSFACVRNYQDGGLSNRTINNNITEKTGVCVLRFRIMEREREAYIVEQCVPFTV